MYNNFVRGGIQQGSFQTSSLIRPSNLDVADHILNNEYSSFMGPSQNFGRFNGSSLLGDSKFYPMDPGYYTLDWDSYGTDLEGSNNETSMIPDEEGEYNWDTNAEIPKVDSKGANVYEGAMAEENTANAMNEVSTLTSTPLEATEAAIPEVETAEEASEIVGTAAKGASILSEAMPVMLAAQVAQQASNGINQAMTNSQNVENIAQYASNLQSHAINSTVNANLIFQHNAEQIQRTNTWGSIASYLSPLGMFGARAIANDTSSAIDPHDLANVYSANGKVNADADNITDAQSTQGIGFSDGYYNTQSTTQDTDETE